MVIDQNYPNLLQPEMRLSGCSHSVFLPSQDLTGGAFETNLNMLNLKEGVDYYHFN